MVACMVYVGRREAIRHSASEPSAQPANQPLSQPMSNSTSKLHYRFTYCRTRAATTPQLQLLHHHSQVLCTCGVWQRRAGVGGGGVFELLPVFSMKRETRTLDDTCTYEGSVAFNDQRRGRRMRIECAGDTSRVCDRDGRSLFHAVKA